MALFHAVKDPGDTKSFGFNWVPFLNGDLISTSVWTAEAGLTVVSQSNTTTTSNVKVSGGTVGNTYLLTNEILLNTSGDIIQRSIAVTVREL